MDLSNLSPSRGANRQRKRLGRGPGSGLGKTSGKGHKGRGARSGGNTPPGYEGGQMPLQRRLPKHGFHNPFRREFEVVNLEQLEVKFGAGSTVDPDALAAAGLIRPGRPVKVLANGELTKALKISAHAFSGAAAQKIVAAGGSTEVVSRA